MAKNMPRLSYTRLQIKKSRGDSCVVNRKCRLFNTFNGEMIQFKKHIAKNIEHIVFKPKEKYIMADQ